MNLRTEITIQEKNIKINPDSKIVCFGSCFANNLGNFLVENKFHCLSNPFGILFNPISIFKLIELSLLNQKVDQNHLLELHERYLSYDFHSKLNATSKADFLELLENLIKDTKEKILNADLILFTFGTSWVHKLNGNIIANCHKQPSNLFAKDLLSVKEITEAFNKIAVHFKQKVILTVSPIRHTKEGLENNMLSKAILRVASHEISKQNKNVSYFPAYEILLDDLRDYRFYDSDLIHPNSVAINYVIDKFQESYFSKDAKLQVKSWKALQQKLNHKPFNINSEAHRLFLEKLLLELIEFNKQTPILEEINQVKSQLEKL